MCSISNLSFCSRSTVEKKKERGKKKTITDFGKHQTENLEKKNVSQLVILKMHVTSSVKSTRYNMLSLFFRLASLRPLIAVVRV